MGHFEATVHFSLERHCELLTFFALFNSSHLSLIVLLSFLYLPQVISNFHLLLNQILSLGKAANKFLPFFLLQTPSLSLADPVPNLK